MVLATSASIPYSPIPPAADFRLCAGVGSPTASCPGRSPAIDAGVNVGLPFSGAAPDLGAEESDLSLTRVISYPTSCPIKFERTIALEQP